MKYDPQQLAVLCTGDFKEIRKRRYWYLDQVTVFASKTDKYVSKPCGLRESKGCTEAERIRAMSADWKMQGFESEI